MKREEEVPIDGGHLWCQKCGMPNSSVTKIENNKGWARLTCQKCGSIVKFRTNDES